MTSAMIKIGADGCEHVFVLTDDHGAGRGEVGAPMLVDASGKAWQAYDCPWDTTEGLIARAIVHYGDVELRDDPAVNELIRRFMAVPMPKSFPQTSRVWAGFVGND